MSEGKGGPAVLSTSDQPDWSRFPGERLLDKKRFSSTCMAEKPINTPYEQTIPAASFLLEWHGRLRFAESHISRKTREIWGTHH